MSRRFLWLCSGLLAYILGGMAPIPAHAAEPAKGTQPETTIVSDALHLKKGGQETLFKGNALLKQLEQWIKADEITRYRLTGIAEAHGHVRGTWFSPQGEKIIGTGDQARYVPLTQTTDLWSRKGPATLTRWETVRDTAPVVMQALHFTAKQQENVMLAHDQVVINQAVHPFKRR
jgi:lipopolysaccharide export system protein LptA